MSPPAQQPTSTPAHHPVDASTPSRQHTLAGEIRVSGKGLLLGQHADVVICPAPVNHGIVFERTDLQPPVQVPAIATNVAKSARRTTLRVGTATVETVEHCLSALAGLKVDNALIRIAGPELPCGDGSASPFVEPIERVGLAEQDAPRRVFRITEPILVTGSTQGGDDEGGGAMLAAFPSDTDEMQLMYDLDYGDSNTRIRRQAFSWHSRNGAYAREIAPARTFSLAEEAKALQASGLCKHLTPRDMLVIGEHGPIDNAFRFENEPVRHKLVDLIGDLSLVGCAVHGRFVAHKSGHDLNCRMAKAIMAQRAAADRQSWLRDGREMNIRTIQRLLPHRYPMLLVDRVVRVEGEQRAIGIKNVTINEPFFQGHYPGTPIMPGVLVVEAMAQLGGLLMSQKLEHTGKIAVLLSLDRVKLRHPITPGDQLVLEAEAIRAKARTGSVKCTAWVGSKLAAEAQIRFMMVDAEQDEP